jgi:hypothetical protein
LMAPRKRPPPLPPGSRTYYNFSVYYDNEGRWVADCPGSGSMPGLVCRGDSAEEALTKSAMLVMP